MSDIITVTGVVATPPRVSTVAGDLKITSFRLASGQRRFDKGRNRWVDAEPLCELAPSQICSLKRRRCFPVCCWSGG